MKCPICGCLDFFVKDAEDEFETHEFRIREGAVVFAGPAEGHPVIDADTRIHCHTCSWNGRYRDVSG